MTTISIHIFGVHSAMANPICYRLQTDLVSVQTLYANPEQNKQPVDRHKKVIISFESTFVCAIKFHSKHDSES